MNIEVKKHALRIRVIDHSFTGIREKNCTGNCKQNVRVEGYSKQRRSQPDFWSCYANFLRSNNVKTMNF